MSLLRWIVGARSETGVRTADLLSDEKWLIDGLGGRRTSSGVHVRGTQALTLDAYYACVRNIGEDLGKMTREVRRRLSTGGSERITTGPGVQLIRRRVSPGISDQAFVEAMAMSALHRGFGLAEIQRDKDTGHPIRCWPIHAGLVEIKEDHQGLYALVHAHNGHPRVVIPWEDMFYVHGVGFDGVRGYGLIDLAQEDLGEAVARKNYAGAFYRNRTQVGGVLEYTRRLEPLQLENLRKSWTETYGVGGESWKPVILESGMSWKPTAVPPKDAQFVESEGLSVIRFCRWTRMPPHKVSELTRATYTNIEHQGIEYVGDCIMPWVIRFEREYDSKILGDPDGVGDLYSHFVVQSLMRGDFTSRTNGYRTMVSTGGMTLNEMRELEDLPRSNKPGADSLWLQGAMRTVESLAELSAKPPEPPPSPKAPGDGDGDGGGDGEADDEDVVAAGDDDAVEDEGAVSVAPALAAAVDVFQAAARDVAGRGLRRYVLAAGRRAKSHADRDPAGYVQWARVEASRMADWIRQQGAWVPQSLDAAAGALGVHVRAAHAFSLLCDELADAAADGCIDAMKGGAWPGQATVDHYVANFATSLRAGG